MKHLLSGLLSLCLLFVAIVPADSATQIREDAAWYRVYLGTGTGTPVTPDAIEEFIDTVVSKRFPDGLTVLEGKGQWASKEHRLIREKSIIVDIQCADSDDNFKLIREIADTYIKRFADAKASCFVKRIPGTTTILYYQ